MTDIFDNLTEIMFGNRTEEEHYEEILKEIKKAKKELEHSNTKLDFLKKKLSL